MTADLRDLMRLWHAPLEARLAERLPLSTLAGADRLDDAVRYAVFPGGRRWRPALTLLGAMAADVPAEAVLDAACGVEFVHSASLVLDDLPAMDDGRERRGRPTLHLVFGEGIAVLAALALLNRGYELFVEPAPGGRGAGYRLLREAVAAIGADGMIGGQAADLSGRDRAPLSSRERKTTTLVRLAVVAGAIAGGADQRDVDALGRYGECLGAAYQIHDDMLDADGSGEQAGKTLRQDARHGRGSWPASAGAGAARAAAAAVMDEGIAAVANRFGDRPAARLLAAAATEILDLIAGSLVPAQGPR